jgi:DNA-binding beta-propeller fold protein YncE
VGHSPRSIAVSPDGRSAYVSNGEDDTISVLRVGE